MARKRMKSIRDIYNQEDRLFNDYIERRGIGVHHPDAERFSEKVNNMGRKMRERIFKTSQYKKDRAVTEDWNKVREDYEQRIGNTQDPMYAFARKKFKEALDSENDRKYSYNTRMGIASKGNSNG